MPPVQVVLFAREDGSCPLIEWLDGLPTKVQDKCIVRIERLAEMGHELHRPEADYLRDDIYELRVSFQRIQYRMLYFFHSGQCVISHGLIKKRKEVEQGEIDHAIVNKVLYEKKPLLHKVER